MRRLLSALALALVVAGPVPAQRQGEYLNEEEQEMIRVNQEIDKRAEVFLKIADRRLVALTTPNVELSGKELTLFGALPKGSQADLLDAYRRTLDEYMAKLDDTFERKGRSGPLKKALERTQEEIRKQAQVLAGLRLTLKDPGALHSLERAVDTASLLAEGAENGLKEP